MPWRVRVGFALALTLGAIALLAALGIAGAGSPPLLPFAILGAGVAVGAAFGLLHRENREKLEEIRAFADRAREDLAGASALREGGDPAWHRSARALNALMNSIREHVDDESRVRDRLETVISALDDAFLVVSLEGRVLFANPPLAAMFSMPEDAVGRSALEVVRDQNILDALDAALRGKAYAGEIQLGAAGEVHVRCRVSPFPSGAAPVGAVALFHDISELRRAESARSDFLANASHEIKTPLSAVRGYAEILADRDPGDASAVSKRAIEAILNNAKRLTALVEDLLELSRIEGGSLQFEKREFDAENVVRALLRDFEARSQARQIEIAVETSGRSAIEGDRRAFEQVVGNLVENAIKYGADGGALRVCVGRPNGSDRLRVEVHDNGPGISPRHQDRVFERFYRVDPGRSRESGGTGLGLAIVKHLVQGMGGEVGVKSDLGRGSCFWFELPAVDASPTRSGR